jgi:hypothetical protein
MKLVVPRCLLCLFMGPKRKISPTTSMMAEVDIKKVSPQLESTSLLTKSKMLDAMVSIINAEIKISIVTKDVLSMHGKTDN